MVSPKNKQKKDIKSFTYVLFIGTIMPTKNSIKPINNNIPNISPDIFILFSFIYFHLALFYIKYNIRCNISQLRQIKK